MLQSPDRFASQNREQLPERRIHKGRCAPPEYGRRSCRAAAEWSSFPERRARSERNGTLRGIGMATYTERCGGGFPETASIEFKDDDRVELVMGCQEYGTGLITAYKQLVSDQLGVDADRIDVIMGDTDRTPAGLTGGSRAIAVGGAALHEAGRTIIEKGTQLAAHLLEASAHDVVFSFQTIMNPKVPVPAVRSTTDQLRWIEAYDDHTLAFEEQRGRASQAFGVGAVTPFRRVNTGSVVGARGSFRRPRQLFADDVGANHLKAILFSKLARQRRFARTGQAGDEHQARPPIGRFQGAQGQQPVAAGTRQGGGPRRLAIASEHAMTEQSHEHPPAEHVHVQGGPSFQLYMNVFYALSVFTALSFVFNELARHDIISYMTSVTLIVIVAVVKALCVATIFMHLKFDWGRVYCIIIPVSIMAVMMVIVLLPDIVLGWHHGLYTPPAHAQAIEGTPGH